MQGPGFKFRTLPKKIKQTQIENHKRIVFDWDVLKQFFDSTVRYGL